MYVLATSWVFLMLYLLIIDNLGQIEKLNAANSEIYIFVDKHQYSLRPSNRILLNRDLILLQQTDNENQVKDKQRCFFIVNVGMEVLYTFWHESRTKKKLLCVK